MDTGLIKAYYRTFGNKYHQDDIFRQYPETKLIPAYLRTHFADARTVLDLGFGTGLWFWASFLSSLKRLDGIDASPEALEEADKVFGLREVPAGYRLAHERAGSTFTARDLDLLRAKRGRFFFLDYRAPWPAEIPRDHYDLVTETGGGFGQMDADQQVIDAVGQCARILKPAGRLLFVNFVMTPKRIEKEVGKVPAPSFCLRQSLFEDAVARAGLSMVDFHTVERPSDMPGVETFFYGFARR
jgi:SAM-dependent methyltransferase